MRKIIFIFSFLLLSGLVYAEPLKVGCVRVRKILQEYKEMQEGMASLRKIFQETQQEIEKKRRNIRELTVELEKKAILLSEDMKNEKREEIKKKIQSLESFATEARKSLQEKEKSLNERVIEKVKGIIHAVAKRKGFDLILNKSSFLVLYAKDRLDITDLVLKDLEKNPKK